MEQEEEEIQAVGWMRTQKREEEVERRRRRQLRNDEMEEFSWRTGVVTWNRKKEPNV